MATRISTWLRRWREWVPLLIILAAGAALRFYQVGQLPPGLYRDEAFYGLDALNVLRGHPALYFAANNGREGLFMYLLAGGIALFGRSAEALRITSALVGTLTVAAIYFTGRNLFSRRIGLLSAAILAVTFWHVAISRVAFRAITLPLLLCVTVALGAGVLRHVAAGEPATRSLKIRAALTGVAFGLTLYTYTSAQFLPILLLVYAVLFVGLSALRVRGFALPAGPAARAVLLLFLVGAFLTVAPFAVWLARHADLYFMRAGQVSILSPVINKGDVLGTLWGNVFKAAGMFVYQGDRIWRHNLSLRPVFDGPLATVFVAGVLVSLWRAVGRTTYDPPTSLAPRRTTGEPRQVVNRQSSIVNQQSSIFVLLWIALFLVPTILAEDTPHYLRAIGALPAACIVAALGLEAVLAWMSRRGLLNLYFGRLRRLISPPALIASALLIVAGVATTTDYFDVYARKDMTAYWLEAQNRALGDMLNAFTANHPPASAWLEDRLANDNPALRYLSPAVEQGQVSIVNAAQPQSLAGAPVLLLVDPNHDWTRLRNALPAPVTLAVAEGPLAQGDLDPAPRRSFIAVTAEALTAQTSHPITFEHGIVLRGAGMARALDELVDGATARGSDYPLTFPITLTTDMGERMLAQDFGATLVYTVTLYWSTVQPIPDDYAVFVHWVHEGHVLKQSDSSPAQGYLPMPTWRPGDVITDQHVLAITGSPREGDELRVGVYRRTDGARLRVLDTAGNALADSLTILRFQSQH